MSSIVWGIRIKIDGPLLIFISWMRKLTSGDLSRLRFWPRRLGNFWRLTTLMMTQQSSLNKSAPTRSRGHKPTSSSPTIYTTGHKQHQLRVPYHLHFPSFWKKNKYSWTLHNSTSYLPFFSIFWNSKSAPTPSSHPDILPPQHGQQQQLRKSWLYRDWPDWELWSFEH